jgi:hypothetical protein
MPEYQSKQQHKRAETPARTTSEQGPLNRMLGFQRQAGNQAMVGLMRQAGVLPAQTERKPSLALEIRRQLQAGPPLRIQRLATWAGDFDMDYYNLVTTKGMDGVDMKLHFTPGKHVRAEEIGMVQTVNSADKSGVNTPGTTAAEKAVYKSRNIPTGQPGAGTRTDRIGGERNPLYGTQSTAKTTSLKGSGASNYGNIHHGKRFVDKTGAMQKEDAWMTDTPQRSSKLLETKMVFETSALAVKGIQAGTYYGSVEWGWQKNAAGTVTKLPFKVVSNDVPSDIFNAAAKQWGTTKDTAGNAVLALPTAVGKYANIADAPIYANNKRFGKLAKNTRLEVTQLSKKFAKVTVIDGLFIGKVGWMRQDLLSDAKVK